MRVEAALAEHIEAVRGLVEASGPVLGEISTRIAECFGQGGKLLICGNGGSAADAQHFAAEFVNRMHVDRPPLPAIALSTDTSAMTAIANDADYACIFSRQVEALGRSCDVLIALTTSGRSRNVLAAIAAARAAGMTTIAFTGRAGVVPPGPTPDIVLAVPADSTPRVQEAHEFAYHVIAALVERRLFGSPIDAATSRELE